MLLSQGEAQRAVVCRIQNPCVLPRADMLKDPLYMPAQKLPCFRLFVYVNFSGASNYEAGAARAPGEVLIGPRWRCRQTSPRQPVAVTAGPVSPPHHRGDTR